MFAHEVGVHLLSETQEVKKAISAVQDQLNTNKMSLAVRKAFRQVPENTKPELMAEETLAYLVQQSPKVPLVRRIINKLKNALRKAGVKIELSHAELRQIVLDNLERNRTPQETDQAIAVVEEDIRFSAEKRTSDGSRIESDAENILRLRAMFDSATDVLRRQPKLRRVAEAVDQF